MKTVGDSGKSKSVLMDNRLAEHHVKNVLDMAKDFFNNTQPIEVNENGSTKKDNEKK